MLDNSHWLLPAPVRTLVKQMAESLSSRYGDRNLCHQYAWWMLEAATGVSRAVLLSRPVIELSSQEKALITLWIDEQLRSKIPLAYLLGSVPFIDLDIVVRPPVLIPRSETEEWTARLIADLIPYAHLPLSILDLCSGSGCIALAIARTFPRFQVLGVDISEQAQELARENALRNRIANVSWIVSDLFGALPPLQRYDLIVANPPYLSSEAWLRLDDSVRQWEDTQALVAADQGMALIKKILITAPSYLNNQRIIAHHIGNIWLEIDSSQGQELVEFMRQERYSEIRLLVDMYKQYRVVVGNAPHVANKESAA